MMGKLQGLLFLFVFYGMCASADTVFDERRNRHIPIAIHLPDNTELCSSSTPCPVAFVSAGYGVSHTSYQFLVDVISEEGYLVVTVGHELPQDPPLSVSGNLYETRAENWQRGADTNPIKKLVTDGCPFSAAY